MDELNPSRLAIETDEQMLAATPEDIKAYLTWENRAPPGWRDQLNAANRAAKASIVTLAARQGHEWRPERYEGMPDWIRLSALETLHLFGLGRARTCMHSPRIESPQPVCGFAWMPDLITCTGCTHLCRVTKVKDHTCDRCGMVVETIHPCSITLGPMRYRFGLCRPCFAEEWPVDAGLMEKDPCTCGHLRGKHINSPSLPRSCTQCECEAFVRRR